MVGQLVHKQAREDPDGIRTAFTVPEPYADGTLRVCLNGRSILDDWSITGYLEVTLEEAPLEEDVVSFWYQQV
jgi:hypothetical protein